MDITDKIRSLRESVGVKYVRPDPKKVDFFIENLFNTRHPQALEYLTSLRGLTHETIKHFKLGYDIERGAIAIPIFKGNELINFKYRYLESGGEKSGRYTSERDAETWVFNEDAIEDGKRKGGILIVEGEIDCMSAWQMGIKNVVAPSAGAQSYGPWLEQIDKIKRIYIAFDNDDAGKKAGENMAERLGSERCYRVVWPDKDANDFLLRHPQDDIKDLIKEAKPFIASQFKSLGDVIKSLRESNNDTFVSRFIPSVDFQRGWMAIISGRSNVGKTSYVLNIASEFTSRGIACLVLPYERGIDSVGQRFLGLMAEKSLKEMTNYKDTEWDELSIRAAERPLYFALPDKKDASDFILKAKRFFNTEVVIIDHLDYMIRQVDGNKGDAIADTLQRLKRVAEDNGIILLIVSHIRKIEAAGTFIARSRRPNIEDLKGSSSLYQDPEVVVMLSETLNDDEILVDVVKNKGNMTDKTFHIDRATGVFSNREPINGIWED